MAKRDGIAGQLAHVTIVGLVTVLALAGDMPQALPLVVVVTTAHLIIERLTIAARDRLDARGLFVFTVDQSLHALSLVAAVSLLGGWEAPASSTVFGVPLSLASVAALCGLLTVSFGGSILVFETESAAISQPGKRDDILQWNSMRVFGLFERGAAFALGIALSPIAILIPFVPRVIFAFVAGGEARARSMVGAAVGLTICVAAYAVFVILAV